jgi:hypothetical protein
MPEWYEFSVEGKRNLKVNRIGERGTGHVIHVVLTVSSRKRKPKWRGLWLDLETNKAGWLTFESRGSAEEWANQGSMKGVTQIG